MSSVAVCLWLSFPVVRGIFVVKGCCFPKLWLSFPVVRGIFVVKGCCFPKLWLSFSVVRGIFVVKGCCFPKLWLSFSVVRGIFVVQGCCFPKLWLSFPVVRGIFVVKGCCFPKLKMPAVFVFLSSRSSCRHFLFWVAVAGVVIVVVVKGDCLHVSPRMAVYICCPQRFSYCVVQGDCYPCIVKACCCLVLFGESLAVPHNSSPPISL